MIRLNKDEPILLFDTVEVTKQGVTRIHIPAKKARNFTTEKQMPCIPSAGATSFISLNPTVYYRPPTSLPSSISKHKPSSTLNGSTINFSNI